MNNMPDKQTVGFFFVVGTYAAGVSAAIYAAAAGHSVLLCEKAPRIGGTTALSNAMRFALR